MRSAAHLELVRGSITTAATLAHERTLPVDDQLQHVVPSGRLQRGSTVAVHGVGATSFALALAGQAIRDGSFLAVIAPASFGLSACLDFDIPLRRVVQFVLPDDASNWAQAVAAIVEGFDVVVLADRHRVSHSQGRQLVARNRERGSVLMRVSGPPWSDAADLRFDVAAPTWSGLGQGYGHLQARQVTVQVAGRRHHAANRVHHLLLPALDGGVQAAVPPVVTHAQDRFAGRSAAVSVPTTESDAASRERFAGADIDALLDVVEGDIADSSMPDHGAIA